jgi:hypothetical protein
MKLKRLGLPKIAAISAAFVMVVVGLVLCRVSGDPEAAAALDHTTTAALEASPGLEGTDTVADAPEAGPAEVAPATGEVVFARDAAPRAPSPSSPRAAAAPDLARPSQSARPAPTRSLPPLPPPNWEAVSAPSATLGPPPGVLWLSGVVQGEPQVAVLRRGENRYVVTEGDVFETSYRVVDISSNTITLQRGSRKQTLRVGQY